jgi:hypothetical protein
LSILIETIPPAILNLLIFDMPFQTFPIKGDYHFRFLKSIDGGLNVWFDINDEDASVPTFDGIISSKNPF